MKPLFNKTFFKFTGRFLAIVTISVASIFLIRYIEVQNTQTASIAPTEAPTEAQK